METSDWLFAECSIGRSFFLEMARFKVRETMAGVVLIDCLVIGNKQNLPTHPESFAESPVSHVAISDLCRVGIPRRPP